MTRDEIIELIRTKYDPQPNDWPRHRGWDDGAGEIADDILRAHAAPELLAHAAPDMLDALKAVEDWWLETGMKEASGAPYAIFAVRAAITKATAYDPVAAEPSEIMRRFDAAIKAIKKA